MTTRHKKEKAERKELQEMLSGACEHPAQDADFTSRVLEEARRNRPAPLLLRFCNKATVFFCSPIWIFIAIGAGICILRDRIIIAVIELYDKLLCSHTVELSSLLLIGGLSGLILFACRETIRETDH